MNFKITSHTKNLEVFKILDKKYFETNFISDMKVDIVVKNNNHYNEFINILAFFLTATYYKEFQYDALKDVTKREMLDFIIESDLKENEDKIYYVSNLEIILKEYFKYNNELLIDSFILFNCSGFKKEVYKKATMYKEHYFKESPKLDENLTLLEIETSSDDINDSENQEDLNELSLVIQKIRQNITKSKLSRVYIKLHSSGSLEFCDENKIFLNKLALIDNYYYSFDDYEDYALFLIMIICLYDIEEIVFEQSITEDILKILLSYIYSCSSLSSFIKNIKLYTKNEV